MMNDFSEAPAASLAQIAQDMHVPSEKLSSTLGLNAAQLELKFEYGGKLTKDEDLLVSGLRSLICQIELMVRESGDPVGFDAAAWLGEWMYLHIPALGGRTAASYMNTLEGQRYIANLLLTMQTGAYV